MIYWTHPFGQRFAALLLPIAGLIVGWQKILPPVLPDLASALDKEYWRMTAEAISLVTCNNPIGVEDFDAIRASHGCDLSLATRSSFTDEARQVILKALRMSAPTAASPRIDSPSECIWARIEFSGSEEAENLVVYVMRSGEIRYRTLVYQVNDREWPKKLWNHLGVAFTGSSPVGVTTPEGGHDSRTKLP